MKRSWLFILLILPFAGCESDFNPIVPTRPVPLIYGIINPDQGQYQVRLTRTFAGEGNALEYAAIGDSIYFSGARMFLETRTPGGALVERAELIDTIIGDRVPGIFATSPNRIFTIDSSGIHLKPEFFEASGRPYDLNLFVKAVIPGYADTVSAFTRLRSVPRINEPRTFFKKVFFYNEDPFWMQWTDTNSESLFQILVRMHYTDFYYDGQSDQTAEWVLTGIETNLTSFPGASRKVYSYYFRPENFYAKVAATIKPDPEVEARVCRKIDFLVLSSNREMEYYRNVYEISDDYHEAGYTNVTNGFGLFTTLTTAGVAGMELGRTELDSLASGRYTRHLLFKNY